MTETTSNLEAIFVSAVQLEPGAARSQYLEEVCGEDTDLLDRIGRLLRAHEIPATFLEEPPPGIEIPHQLSVETERVGAVIDTYRLLQKLGEGGFGVVYKAQQIEPICRVVAIKVLKPSMNTNEVIARFEAERQALAMLTHPNIARILDAGATEDSRPYFVMELVEGVPLTEYCDKNRIPIRERLELFSDVCHGVQHAHHHGIIHRDLKPMNVLVTVRDGTPIPKVIDFGIAKAIGGPLHQQPLLTAFGQLLGTPAYMSPEQAEMSGSGVDTRCDVYSLGVLL